jgi:hypothetical protein
MLTIRKEQMQVLSEAVEKRFMERMVLHVREYFPESCKDKEYKDLMDILVKGARRAKGYGITEQRDICKYFNSMFVMGHEFDNDEAYPWAKEILNDTSLTLGSSKMIKLCNAARDHISNV